MADGPAPASGPVLALRRFSLRHPGAERAAVGPLDLEIAAGERVLLLGPSGCGKSSLIQGVTGVVPGTRPGTVTGDIVLFGAPAATRAPSDWADQVGTLLQSAEEVLIGPQVHDDVAFGPEALGKPAQQVVQRVTRALDRAGASHLDPARPVASLSGGEKQRVALAGVLALEPALLILDEPTAQLDPTATRRVHALLDRQPDGPACLIVDHRLDGLVERIDRVLVLGACGMVIAHGPPETLFHAHAARLEKAGIWLPLATQAARALGVASRAVQMGALVRQLPANPTTLRRAADWLSSQRPPPAAKARQTASILALKDAAIAPPGGPTVLRGVSLALHAGERLGIAGRNGSGKSSLAAVVAGLRRPVAGRRSGEPAWLVLQNPDHHASAASVEQDLAGALRAAGRRADAQAVQTLAARWRLADMLMRHPFELSQGEKRRLSLALAEAGPERAAWILDEPTYGLDAAATGELIAALDDLAGRGIATVIISHDMELLARCCARLVLLGEGQVLADGPAGMVLHDPDLLARAGLARPGWAPLADWLEARA